MRTISEVLAHPQVKGVCVGWCPDGTRLLKGCDGHAHQGKAEGELRGLICVHSQRHYTVKNLRHELAHIIRGNTKHDEAYWAVVRELGGRKHRYTKEAN